MDRNTIQRFYENKIEDVHNDFVYEKLMKKLEEVYDLLFEIEAEVESELERQDDEELPNFPYDEEEEMEKYYIRGAKNV